MTAYTEIELRCDGMPGPFDCDNVIHHRTITRARAEARRAGWRVQCEGGGKDYCPEHRGGRQ